MGSGLTSPLIHQSEPHHPSPIRTPCTLPPVIFPAVFRFSFCKRNRASSAAVTHKPIFLEILVFSVLLFFSLCSFELDGHFYTTPAFSSGRKSAEKEASDRFTLAGRNPLHAYQPSGSFFFIEIEKEKRTKKENLF
jgi:hypothetical protein